MDQLGPQACLGRVLGRGASALPRVASGLGAILRNESHFQPTEETRTPDSAGWKQGKSREQRSSLPGKAAVEAHSRGSRSLEVGLTR